MKGNLLLVDDEKALVNRIAQILEDCADHVYKAYNGKEALRLLEEQEIHCIVCDIKMPEMDGVEVIRRIRENGFDRPFIFYTGHGDQDLMMEAIKYGAFDFLHKPHLDHLGEIVARGLKEGIGQGPIADESAYMSEFKKLMKQLDNDSD